MKKLSSYNGVDIYTVRNLVVGSGASGLNAASLLKEKTDDVVLVTEGLKCGTSLNTGSDKQTYYKLSLAGGDNDSVHSLAEDLFEGGAVDGDIALCEASSSAEGFLRLVSLGVPFPRNRWGEYIGYKTDHDPHKRATSAGPYTSRFMTEALLQEVRKQGLEIVDGYQLIKIFSENNTFKGALFIERKTGKLMLILSEFAVVATGGPAGIYKNSVYPESQFGASGILFDAGVSFVNVTEWQYGLASIKPRWNVSGSYMQTLPRFVSIDEKGNEHEFLFEHNIDEYTMLSNIFLKGYQWPFDARKVENGSSIIDIFVYLELEKGRKVFLDYTKNRFNKEIEFEKLSREAYEYLKKADCLLPTPLERLKKLNAPAYEFYLEHGVDLEKEYLDISLSSQHNNGGAEVSPWWESSVNNLFVVGEAAGTHGVYRPGGSALNSGQVGSRRAAQMIGKRNKNKEKDRVLDNTLKCALDNENNFISNALTNDNNVREEYDSLKEIMSLQASAIREEKALKEALSFTSKKDIKKVGVKDEASLWMLYEYKNALLTSKFYIYGFIDYLKRKGLSRGSALYSVRNGKIHPKCLDDRFTYNLESKREDEIISIKMTDGEVKASVRKVREIPNDDDFFENIWASFRKDGNVY